MVVGAIAIDVAGAGGVVVLPDAEVAVDHTVVQPEDWVAGRGIYVAHDATDAVMAVGVRTLLSAPGKVLVVVQRPAAVDDVGVGVGRVGGIAVAGEAVVLVELGRAGTDVQGKVGKLLWEVSHTVAEQGSG